MKIDQKLTKNGQNWRGFNPFDENREKLAKNRVSRGSPGKSAIFEKKRGKTRGVFRDFSQKMAIFGGSGGGRGQNLSSKRNKHCIAAKLIFGCC